MSSPRVVTTLPAVTEIVCALGVDPVGVSHSCDYPERVADIPTVTSSPIDTDASSAEIDRQVRELAADGVYDIDGERLAALEPDLIITQETCEVCAVDESLVDATLESLAIDPNVLAVDPHTMAGVLATIEQIGTAIGRKSETERLLASLEDRIDAVRQPIADEPRQRVAVLDWTDPVMIAGHWVPELVEWAGGTYPLAEPGDPSRPREWDEILEADPEILIVGPCGFSIEEIETNLADLERPGWADLTAVQDGRVWAMDGSAYLNRPGPRLVDSLEHLAGICQPEQFDSPPLDVARPLLEVAPRL
ncbi:MAG: cobalamin-binding protein [Natrialbaceae archaeon]|nr:cobalamin-binding protein [Natrialbaceae archaeon]